MVEDEEPLDGLKSAILNEDLPAAAKPLLSEFENLTENWDDIFGSSYYEIRSSLFDFVFHDSSKILGKLTEHISDQEKLKVLIKKYQVAMRNSHEDQ